MRRKWVIVGATVVVLGAAGTGGYVVWKDVQDEISGLRGQVTYLEGEIEDAAGDNSDQGSAIRELQARPEFDASKLQGDIGVLKSDVRFLMGSNRRLWSVAGLSGGSSGGFPIGAGVDASDIEKPYLCFRGDVAVWDFNGLTC